MPLRRASRLTAWLLVGANLAVAASALTRRQGYLELLLVYFAETVVIGVLNVPKMLIVALFRDVVATLDDLREAAVRFLVVLLGLLASVVIFTLLWMLLYVAIMLVPMLLEQADRAAGIAPARGSRGIRPEMRVELLALALSHVVSFVVNFLFGREFRGGSFIPLVLQPLARTFWIIVVIVLAMAVAFVQPVLSRSTAFTVVVVGAKILVDCRAHLAERRRFRPAPPPAA
jgi:uncharacterized protein DUF6498